MSQAEAQTQAENKLARLGVQVEAMQAVLVRLLQDVVRAEHQLDSHQGTQLLQANEQLVVAALHSQADAAAAALSLKQAVLSPTLDVLTQLPNRATLHDHFLLALANAKRHGGGLALMFLDLDNFKQLNDSLGHAFGDKVLRLVADRLVTHVREVDTVSRHGGDEFLILLVDVNQPRDVQHIAEKLIQALSAPAEINGQRVAISASIGVAFCDLATDNLESLTARADAAMYHSKRQRLGGVAFHGLPLQAAFAGLDGSDDGRAPRPATHPSAPMHAELVPNSQHLPQPPTQPPPHPSPPPSREGRGRANPNPNACTPPCAKPTKSCCWPRFQHRSCRPLPNKPNAVNTLL